MTLLTQVDSEGGGCSVANQVVLQGGLDPRLQPSLANLLTLALSTVELTANVTQVELHRKASVD